MPVNGGDYTIVGARARSQDEWKTTVKVPVEKGKIAVDVPKLEEPGAKASRSQQPSSSRTSRSSRRPEPSRVPATTSRSPSTRAHRCSPRKRKIALARRRRRRARLVGGRRVRHGGEGEGERRVRAVSRSADAVRRRGARRCAGRHARETKALIANIAFGVAGAAAIGAAVLWFTGAPESGADVAVVPGPGSLTVVGKF